MYHSCINTTPAKNALRWEEKNGESFPIADESLFNEFEEAYRLAKEYLANKGILND